MYADDATSVVTSVSFVEMYRLSNLSYLRIEDWMKAKKLVLNNIKTVNRSFSYYALWSFQNWGIRSHHFFGTELDSHLIWHTHVDNIAEILSKNIFVLTSIKSSVNKKIVLMVFHATIRTRLAYAILAWGHAPAAERVFGLQRNALWIVDNLGYRDDCINS